MDYTFLWFKFWNAIFTTKKKLQKGNFLTSLMEKNKDFFWAIGNCHV